MYTLPQAFLTVCMPKLAMLLPLHVRFFFQLPVRLLTEFGVSRAALNQIDMTGVKCGW